MSTLPDVVAGRQIRTLRSPAGMDSYATTRAAASGRSYAIMVLSCGQSRRGT
jgi:hypothetical protein